MIAWMDFRLTRFLHANRHPPRIASGAGFRFKTLLSWIPAPVRAPHPLPCRTRPARLFPPGGSSFFPSLNLERARPVRGVACASLGDAIQQHHSELSCYCELVAIRARINRTSV